MQYTLAELEAQIVALYKETLLAFSAKGATEDQRQEHLFLSFASRATRPHTKMHS